MCVWVACNFSPFQHRDIKTSCQACLAEPQGWKVIFFFLLGFERFEKLHVWSVWNLLEEKCGVRKNVRQAFQRRRMFTFHPLWANFHSFIMTHGEKACLPPASGSAFSTSQLRRPAIFLPGLVHRVWISSAWLMRLIWCCSPDTSQITSLVYSHGAHQVFGKKPE